ncbi:MAG: hypothetical protein IT230_13435 [Flavobacteriales bacterium]|nr:hypothetical protein [Flavobacteriales bacterium]
MNKFITLLFAAVLAPCAANAQEHCAAHTITDRWLHQHGIAADLAHDATVLEQQGMARGGLSTVPVVVHVVWNTTAENVSNTVIQNIITRLNEDYQAQNADYDDVRTQFLSSRGNPMIQFCLATTDPGGDPTEGITRTQTTQTWFDPDTETDDMKFATYGKPAWNTSDYLNIWICDISSGASGGLVTAGYAYLPVGGIVGTNIDGLVLDYSYGTMDRTASHEVGHYFGLSHPWGGGNGNCNPGDGISDTPATDSPTFSCSNTSLMKCGTLTQYENYMDYSNCPVMFTNGQATVMNNTLGGVRSSLLASNGCAGSSSGPCTPTAAVGTGEGDFIDGVQLGSINNTGSGAGPAYNNFMSMSATLAEGASYNLIITGGTYSPDHYAAWIDYNADNTFSSAEKLGEFTSSAPGQSQTINFSVPAGATPGSTRLRVRGVYHNTGEPTPGTDPCFNYAFGETEDYGINITGGGSSLCIPTAIIGTADGDFIDGVSLGAIQNTGSGSTEAPTYHDYTANFSTSLSRGASYTLQVTTGEYSQDLVAAWIDFNGNDQLSASEKLGEDLSSSPFQTIPFTFTVPQNAVLGATVMRVRVMYPDDANGEPETADPCFSFTWGETEDYGINITGPTGIDGRQQQGLVLLQLPGQVQVSWPVAAGDQQLVLVDGAGRRIRHDAVTGNRWAINTEGLAAGLYQLILVQDQQREAARFVVFGQ